VGQGPKPESRNPLYNHPAMPRMIPARPDDDAPDSERKVFAALEKQLPAAWTVFHSRRVVVPSAGRGPATECELDFLVVDPSRGLLGLEVKGGRVGRDENGWWQDGRPIRSPAKQVQRAVHMLRRYLEDRRLSLALGWGVVLPDVTCPDHVGPDLPRTLVVDADGMRWLDRAVESLFESALGAGAPMPPTAVEQLVKTLAPRLALVPSLAVAVDQEEAALVRITAEQLDVLEVLADISRLGIRGGAGTGKSLVAMERARRLAADGKRVLLLCFNRGLATHLQARADGFRVSTFHSLCGDLAKRTGLADPKVPTGPEAQAFWQDEAPKRLMTALDRLPDERFDGVVVDEGQDFYEYWWIAVEKLLRRLNDDVLWVFFDPRQDIFGTGAALSALHLQSASLTFNCRNTAQIARYAYGLTMPSRSCGRARPRGSRCRSSAAPTSTICWMPFVVRCTGWSPAASGLRASSWCPRSGQTEARSGVRARSAICGSSSSRRRPPSARSSSRRCSASRGWRRMRWSSARWTGRIRRRTRRTCMWRRRGRGNCLQWRSLPRLAISSDNRGDPGGTDDPWMNVLRYSVRWAGRVSNGLHRTSTRSRRHEQPHTAVQQCEHDQSRRFGCRLTH
jgi:Nuclease-related domain/AAA domain